MIIEDKEITIKEYTGTDKEIFVPEKIRDLPVTVVADRAFFNKGIVKAVIPDSVTSIGDNVFSRDLHPPGYSAEKNEGADIFSIMIRRDAVTIIGYNRTAKEVVIPREIDGMPVRAVGDDAFRKEELTGVYIPDTVTSIGYWAFATNKLKEIAIPSSVRVIKNAAFFGNAISFVEIPDSVEELEEEAFSYQADGDSRYSIMLRGNAATIIGHHIPEKNIVIPRTVGGFPVTAVGAYAFDNSGGHLYNDWMIESVVIPDTVTFIGKRAFSFNRLSAIVIPDSVTHIGGQAFYHNYSDYGGGGGNTVRDVVIPEYVELGAGAVEDDFVGFYNDRGRQAGHYVYNGKRWQIK
jgi:hypothetical protein